MGGETFHLLCRSGRRYRRVILCPGVKPWILRATLLPFILLKAISYITSPGSGANQTSIWTVLVGQNELNVPSPSQWKSHLVSWPRVKNWGFSVLFVLQIAFFCVCCSSFQLELLSLWLFLQILVFDRLTEVSRSKLGIGSSSIAWMEHTSWASASDGLHSTVFVNLLGTYLKSRVALGLMDGKLPAMNNKSRLSTPRQPPAETSTHSRIFWVSFVTEDLVAMGYETGHVRPKDYFNLRALNSFESTPSQFPLELKLERNSFRCPWSFLACQSGYLRCIDRLSCQSLKERLEISLPREEGGPWAVPHWNK